MYKSSITAFNFKIKCQFPGFALKDNVSDVEVEVEVFYIYCNPNRDSVAIITIMTTLQCYTIN